MAERPIRETPRSQNIAHHDKKDLREFWVRPVVFGRYAAAKQVRDHGFYCGIASAHLVLDQHYYLGYKHEVVDHGLSAAGGQDLHQLCHELLPVIVALIGQKRQNGVRNVLVYFLVSVIQLQLEKVGEGARYVCSELLWRHVPRGQELHNLRNMDDKLVVLIVVGHFRTNAHVYLTHQWEQFLHRLLLGPLF